MKLKYTVTTALTGLKTNKSRTFLTILGIVIGVTAIILIMAVGRGGQELILGQIRGLGSRTLIIEPGREPEGPSNFSEIFTDSLKEAEVAALKKNANVPGLGQLTPVVMQPASITHESESVRTNVLGAAATLTNILDVYPAQGVFFTDEDIRQRASVVVIGSEIKNKLFGPSDAVGTPIKIKDRTFRVIGVLPKKGQVGLLNVDEIAAVPYTTAQDYLSGINYFNMVLAQAATEEGVPRTVRDVELTLRELHNITDPDKDDFHVTTQEDIVERVGTVTGILTAILSSVAAISLVVGGVGIMNIMLVSVTERTKEIGLRKALGAKDRDILLQFLIEAVVLTGLGGIVGILLGAFFAFIASIILTQFLELDWAYSFPLNGALLGLGVSAGVGLLFGLYPARQAAKKSPMEALRYE
jgi:putative ABC transport system permease protein